MDVLGEAHINVWCLVVGVVCGCEVSAVRVVRLSCARMGGRADVEMMCWCDVARWVLGGRGTSVKRAWGRRPGVWGLSWVLGGPRPWGLGQL